MRPGSVYCSHSLAVSGGASERFFGGIGEVIDVQWVAREPHRLFDIVIEAVGKPESIPLAIASAAPGARVVLFGLPAQPVTGSVARRESRDHLVRRVERPPRLARVWSTCSAMAKPGSGEVISDHVPFESFLKDSRKHATVHSRWSWSENRRTCWIAWIVMGMEAAGAKILAPQRLERRRGAPLTSSSTE